MALSDYTPAFFFTFETSNFEPVLPDTGNFTVTNVTNAPTHSGSKAIFDGSNTEGLRIQWDGGDLFSPSADTDDFTVVIKFKITTEVYDGNCMLHASSTGASYSETMGLAQFSTTGDRLQVYDPLGAGTPETQSVDVGPDLANTEMIWGVKRTGGPGSVVEEHFIDTDATGGMSLVSNNNNNFAGRGFDVGQDLWIGVQSDGGNPFYGEIDYIIGFLEEVSDTDLQADVWSEANLKSEYVSSGSSILPLLNAYYG